MGRRRIEPDLDGTGADESAFDWVSMHAWHSNEKSTATPISNTLLPVLINANRRNVPFFSETLRCFPLMM